MKNVRERFLKFIQHNTRSDIRSDTCPSTKSQLDFAQLLAIDCNRIGLSDVVVSRHGYVYAQLKANTTKKAPIIGFIAHMDTSPDYSGDIIRGIPVPNYDGGDIALSKSVILSPEEFPSLLGYIGCELITTNGSTLLGADDKAGIAEILTALEYLIENPDIEHGTIKICFTPDEEIGRGADKFDINLFSADFAYTVDGGEVGELEYENFNAARAKIKITGKSVHPGSAKGIMKNAALIAAETAAKFPSGETPATTEGYEGFYHLTDISGQIESAVLEYIIRDFEKDKFEERKAFIKNIVQSINTEYGKNTAVLDMRDEYYNMRDMLQDKLYIIDLAMRAMKAVGIDPKIKAIRGGTDGSKLSYMGLPCPNIFAGGHNFHGPYEYISVESMIKACEVIAKIAELAVEQDINQG